MNFYSLYSLNKCSCWILAYWFTYWHIAAYWHIDILFLCFKFVYVSFFERNVFLNKENKINFNGFILFFIRFHIQWDNKKNGAVIHVCRNSMRSSYNQEQNFIKTLHTDISSQWPKSPQLVYLMVQSLCNSMPVCEYVCRRDFGILFRHIV